MASASAVSLKPAWITAVRRHFCSDFTKSVELALILCLKVLCSYDQALICNRPLEQNCLNQDRHLTEGIQLAARYLCGEGFEIYRDTRHCFAKAELLTSVSACNDSYMNAMSSLPHRSGSFQEKTKLVCRFMKDIVSCVGEATRRVCSEEAAKWISTLKEILMQPAHHKIRCHERLVRPESKRSIIVGISIGACLGFLSLILVVLLLCRKQMTAYTKASKWLSTKSRNTSLGPGRPYSNGGPSVTSAGGASTAPLLLDISPKKAGPNTKVDYSQLRDVDSRCSIQMEQSVATAAAR
ncbi:hypothetical protein CAPTEDRAFT_197299 [Capitella teleta]|uniref:DUF19 domain-containing protein n=1 Tax=Capitella teleta TaxID=283909 RepID=R7TNZ7_CAPTE|nr:hypothetical protein CAPTEDRAFT_197299 [Capitella teleta]|eukprot:ELT95349.1 hypothetical protein CAPTEDRAFT_197299 [Capitella teleta]